MKSPKNKPEDICKCLHAGTLSECFGGTTISMRVQRQSVVSCFIRHPKTARVTCPMGQGAVQAPRHGSTGRSTEAGKPAAPAPTAARTRTKHEAGQHRAIAPSTPVAVRGCTATRCHPLQQLPPGFQPHNSLGRPQKPARVRVTLRRNPEDIAAKKGAGRASLWDGEVV